jgi:ACS family glucarate transporter-like MFS transporter
MPPMQRVRARVLVFLFVLAAITYLDRICIAAAAPFIMADLGLSVLDMSVVFSAFTLAYSLFEVPSGWLGDVKGPRRVLTRIVIWWSAFTMLTGAAQGFRSLVAIRFLFGAGEAGAFPNIARTVSTWFPRRERGRANGVVFLGSRLGGMLSAPLALLVIAQFGWRASFVIFGLLGIVWGAAWFRWYRDRPAAHPAITPEELAWIQQDRAADGVGILATPTRTRPAREGGATPWRALLASRNLYAICSMYFAFGYGLYFYFTWLPTFLIKELGFSLLAGGMFASLPFLLAGLADLGGGWLTDRLTRDYGLRVGRCYLGFAAFLTCGGLVLASTSPLPPIAKAVLLALALASADLALGACWAVPMDIAPDHAGVVTGFMNTLGNLGGLAGPLVVGLVLERWQSWTYAFYITALVYAGGAVAWLTIDPTRAISLDTRSRSTAPAFHPDR